MSIEAMKLALEALETHGAPLLNHEDAYSASLPALRQAIEEAEKQESDDLTIAYMTGFHAGKNTPQPNSEQEPVANGIIRTLVSIDKDGIETWKHEPFYTHPPQREWVGLTYLEIDQIYCDCHDDDGRPLSIKKYERALEDKLREKNGC